MMRHRRGAPAEEEEESSSSDEDAFARLSQKSSAAKKAKLSKEAEKPATAPPANLPLSNTSSMKRHHGALSDRRKAKMESILMDLQDEQHKVSQEPPRQHSGQHQPRGSFVQPGQEDVTTNVFIGNLPPTVNEERVGSLFRQFGELYSVKIMWPRTPEEKARDRLTGFVCFMHRHDAETAMEACNETDPFNAGRRIMMRWGKSVKEVENREESRPLLRPERHGQDSIRVVPPRDHRKDAARGEAQLTPRELEEFDRLTRTELSVSRERICNAMVFCFEKSGAAKQISDLLRDLLLESVYVPSIETRIARLYLVSDILFNSQQPGVRNAFLYRDAIERMAPQVFTEFGKADGQLGRMTLQKLTTAVNAVLAAWADWSVYNPAFMDELHARFEGREVAVEQSKTAGAKEPDQEERQHAGEQAEHVEVIHRTPKGDWTAVTEAEEAPPVDTRIERNQPETDQDVDGEPLDEGNVDGEPLEDEQDIDGEPLDDDADWSPLDDTVDGEPLDDDPDGIPLGEH